MSDEIKECWINVYVVDGKNILGFAWLLKSRAENVFFCFAMLWWHQRRCFCDGQATIPWRRA